MISFIGLIFELLSIICMILILIPAIRLLSISSSMRAETLKANSRLTSEQRRQQKAYIQSHGNKFITFILFFIVFSLMMILVFAGFFTYGAIIDNRGQGVALFLLSALMFFGGTFPLFSLKFTANKQQIKRNYLNIHPENDLNFFVHSHILMQKHQHYERWESALAFVASGLMFLGALLAD